MGEDPDDDAPTDYAPTELGAAIDDTDAHRAWALANEPDELPQAAPPVDEEPDELPRRVTPQRITALAVAGSLVVAGVAAGVSLWHLRDEPDVAEPMPDSASSTPMPTPTASTPQAAPSTGWELPPPTLARSPTNTRRPIYERPPVTAEGNPTAPQESGQDKDGDSEKPGNPAPAQREMEFISSVASQGYRGDSNTIVEAGYRVCSLLDDAVSHEAITRFVTDTFGDQRSNPQYYATLFASYARYNLCPRHMGEYGQI